eukprot:m.294922 g.294922  ORF g.294922 m.294922 type:complete len:244 (+) comp27167_c2_seq10:3627-4358(+)
MKRLKVIFSPVEKDIMSMMSEQSVRSPEPTLRKLLLEVLIRSTAAKTVLTVFRFHAGELETMDNEKRSVLLTGIHLSCAVIAHFAGGWRRSPDAMWMRGAAQMCRGNIAEASDKLGTALSRPESKWIGPSWARGVAAALLKNVRTGGTAVTGRWRCLYGRKAEVDDTGTDAGSRPTDAPTSACATASCQVDDTLYDTQRRRHHHLQIFWTTPISPACSGRTDGRDTRTSSTPQQTTCTDHLTQ